MLQYFQKNSFSNVHESLDERTKNIHAIVDNFFVSRFGVTSFSYFLSESVLPFYGLGVIAAYAMGPKTRLLHEVAEQGHSILKQLLTDNSQDVNVRNKNGRTALQLAAENGRTEAVKVLLADLRVNVHANDISLRDISDIFTDMSFCKSPLYLAAENGHKKTVKVLLADPRVELNIDKKGFTVLMWQHIMAI